VDPGLDPVIHVDGRVKPGHHFDAIPIDPLVL
jgi:hypothetical protein